MKSSDVIQCVYSLNPTPTTSAFISESQEKGFITVSNEQMLEKLCEDLLLQDRHYFSSMLSKEELGKIIHIA